MKETRKEKILKKHIISISLLITISVLFFQHCIFPVREEVDRDICNKVNCANSLCIENIKNISKKFNAEKPDETYSIYLIDQSGSMSASLGSSNRMAVAKQLTIDFVKKIDPELETGKNFGLYAFGGYGCNCIQEIQSPFVEFNKNELIEKINEIKPIGLTPISNSLDVMAGLLDGKKGKYFVTLVTDGMESCGGKPEESAKKLQSIANIKASQITIDLVIAGIEMSESEDAALTKIAVAGNGKYIPVKTESAFKRAYVSTTPFYYELTAAQFNGYIYSTRSMNPRCIDTEIPSEVILSCEKGYILINQSTRKDRDFFHYYLLNTDSLDQRKIGYQYFKENKKPKLRAAYEAMNEKLKDEQLDSEERNLIQEVIDAWKK
ncbi:MAG: VWA domain-containing protein [Leptospiraceae bacterium]|nr:VWA domain-containing protein [Leptospiraceae bacterium]MBK9503723.1 VWA domain-containing protein [Leptospiraceae bacterium]MBL0265449.1 VWA domain-containing protein [Leptospiraceae bacterium]MBP9163648.1 VWA domain-containing protein [Leptospiraceae bacterium]